MAGRPLWTILLGTFLILTGIAMLFTSLHFTGEEVILGLLAVGSGILLWLGR